MHFEPAEGSWIVSAAGRIGRIWRQRGFLATLRFLASRVFRHEIHLVYETSCADARVAVQWSEDERLLRIGPENLDAALNERMESFLGGAGAVESIRGVRNGDCLFVIMSGDEYVHRGYILFKTRASKLLGDAEACPLIAYCWTSPGMRGRSFYRRALAAEVSYLRDRGYKRVLIETDPDNRASQKGIEAAGFTFAWEARVWIVLNSLVIRQMRDHAGRCWRAFFL